MKLKHLKLVAYLIVIYYIIYNSYFGWGEHPIGDAEKMCLKILICSWGMWFAIVFWIVYDMLIKIQKFIDGYLFNAICLLNISRLVDKASDVVITFDKNEAKKEDVVK